jgi:hypothetical protein
MDVLTEKVASNAPASLGMKYKIKRIVSVREREILPLHVTLLPPF